MTPEIEPSLFRIEPGTAVRLSEHDTAWMGIPAMQELGDDDLKDAARAYVASCIDEFATAQELLFADNRYSVLLIFQGMDAAGKDSTIKHVTAGVNPAGFQVMSFTVPTKKELDHNFLWRYWRAMPERGRIGIFNRSYYEDVITVRVHPERGHLTFNQNPVDTTFWNERLEDINNLEKHLARNGTLILKFFLNVSKDEQKRRLMRRLENPEKHWKYDPNDLLERRFWAEYTEAFEAAITTTSTLYAPWFVIPADHKWVMRALVASIIARHLTSMDLRYPEPDEARRQRMAEALETLRAEDAAPAKATKASTASTKSTKSKKAGKKRA
jgi:PPK2 family polyphosphate:nucleotide phosphotransferase